MQLIFSLLHKLIYHQKFSICRKCASAPQDIVAVYPGNFSDSNNVSCSQYVNIGWGQPSTGLVQSYFVECVSSLDRVNKTYESSSLDGILGPLVGGTEYNCSVVAINEYGAGPAARADPFTTL